MQAIGLILAEIGWAIAGLGVGGATAVAIGAAVVVGGSIAAAKAMGLFEIEMPQMDSDASRQTTVKTTVAPQKIIYGEALVSGPISYIALAGSSNADLYQTIVLAGHEVNAITDIHFDDEIIESSWIAAGLNNGSNTAGNVTAGTFGPIDSNTICVINKHLGAASQAADPMLEDKFDLYTTAHRGEGIAYLAMKWTLDEDSAEVWEKYSPGNVKALVQGKKIYDPRLEVAANNNDATTAGDSPNNSAYIAYSTNPALCVTDYLIDQTLGMGIAAAKIDWAAVITAANGCDVDVDVPNNATQKRFTANGVLFGTDSHQKNINKLLSAMNGRLIYSNGKYIVKAGIYEAATEDLTEDDLIGAIQIKTSLERSDRFNTIRGIFVDAAANNKSTEFPKVQLANAVARDNQEVLEKEIQLPMVSNSYQAQRIANKLIQLSDQQKIISFPANLSALRITAGDRVRVTVEELSWSQKVFECIGWTFSDEGGVNLTLREDSSLSYDDPLPAAYSQITSDGVIADGFRGVPSPSGLRAASGEKKVFLNWVNPGKPSDFGTIEIYASASNNIANAVKIGETDGTQFVHDGNNASDQITVDDTRYYWIRSKKNVGTVAENAVSVYQPNSTTGVGPVTVLATLVDWGNVADPTIGIDINNDTISINTGVANTTTGQDVATSGIEAGTTVTQGGITMNQGGSIKGGQSAYNSGTGFFLGYDTNAYKFSIGNASNEALTFDGTNLAVTGAITATSGSIANSVTVGGTAASTVASGAAAGATASQVNAGLALLLNKDTFGEDNTGEASLVSVDKDGIPILETSSITSNGFIQWNGSKITVEAVQYTSSSTVKFTVLTGLADKRGFIVFDTTKSNPFTVGSVAMDLAFAFKEGDQWYYDNNVTATTFTPTNDMVALGYLETGTGDLILKGGLINPVTLTAAAFPSDEIKSGSIGGININASAIYSGSKSSFADTDKGFWIGSNGTMSFANGTANTLEFDTNGDLSVTGNITATSGTFTGTVNASAGAFTGDVSTDSKFIAGSGATSATMDGGDQNYRIYAGGATPDLSSFKVDSDGVVTATRLVVTRPDDLSAVIFDSARDGLVGIGLASISQDTGIVVQAPSAELTSQTDTVSVVLTASQTLTLETILALPTAKKNAGNYTTSKYPASITATMEYSTNSGSSWSTFGAAVVLTRTASPSPSDTSKFGVLTYAIDGLGKTGYRRDVHAIDAINNIHFIKSVAGFAAGSYLFRVQLSFVAGSSPDTDYEPNITGNRTLQFGTDGAGFTVDEYGVITDSPSGTATIGYVQANYVALNNGNTITVGSGETNTFEDESSNEILVVSDTEVVARNLFRATWNGAQPTGTKIIRVTNPTGTAERFSVTEAGNLTTTTLGVTGDATITGDLTVNGTTTTVNTDNLTVKDNNITLNYSTGDSSSTANNSGITIQDAVSASTDASLLWKTASDTFEFSHGVQINQNGDALNIRSTSTGQPVRVTFSSQVPDDQVGHIEYIHLNGQSYGSLEAFIISGTEASRTILADGKLMFNEGIYSKPASGTGAGTRKDANWDTAYTYSQVGHLPLTGGTLTGVTTVKPGTVTGAVVGSNVTLEVQATEGQIQVIADDGGDWASNIVLSNYTASTRRHYWIHNAPSTASANAGKFELRTSDTTTAAYIGGQGTNSTALLVVDSSGNSTFSGSVSATSFELSGISVIDSSQNINAASISTSGITSAGDITLTSTTTSSPSVNFNSSTATDPNVDMAIKLVGEELHFYEPEDNDKVHFKIYDDTGVDAPFGYWVNGTRMADASRNLTVGTISSGAITSSASVIASGNSNSFGNTTIGALSVSTVTASGSITASGNSNSFGNTTLGTISSGAITSTVVNTGDATLLTLHHDTGADLSQQKSFIDFSFEDDNTNETPQVRIGAEVGQNGSADSQIKEGSGAFVVYTNNATTVSGAATGLNERFRVDYTGDTWIKTGVLKMGTTTVIDAARNITAGTISSGAITNSGVIRQTISNVGIPTLFSSFTMEATDAQMDLVSSSAGTWGSALNFVQGTSTTANTNVWSIARKTTSGGNSLNFNFGTANRHDNTTQVSISTTGDITAGAISSGAITSSGKVEGTRLKINVPDGGSSPALTAYMDIYGYEGRGAGIHIRDSANSASNPSNREWFIGSGYAQSGFNIGYSATGSQTSYSAQNKFSLDTSGNAVIAGTISSGAITSSGVVTASGGNSGNWNTAYTVANAALPKAGGTMTGALVLNNTNISGVNAFSFYDPGPNEGISWANGNTAIFESPDDLTTNTAGNLQFVYGTTRRLTVNSSGIDVNGTISSGAITASGTASTKLRQTTAQAGAVLEFSDEPGSWSQNGTIVFRHVDTMSYGSGAMFEIGSDQATTTILADGKLMFKEGLYIKPSSGTAAGTLLISSSGNLTNIGTISSGAITSSGDIKAAGNLWVNYNASGNKYLNINYSAGGDGGILFRHSDVLKWQVGATTSTGNNLFWYSYPAGQTVMTLSTSGLLSTDIGYQVNGTTVIDGSRNVSAAKITTTTASDNVFSGDIVINKSAPYIVIQNSAENNGGIVFNDIDAGAWPAASSQRFMMQYNSGGTPNAFIMGHDEDSYAGFNFATGGNFIASGNVTAYSDERLKSDIQTLDGSKVLQMRGVSFTKDGESGSGVIAQELEKIAPELVHDGEYKSVAYGNLVGYLIENAKQQQSEIDELKALVKTLMEK